MTDAQAPRASHWTHRIPIIGPVAMVRPHWTLSVVTGLVVYFALGAYKAPIQLIGAWDSGVLLFLITTILMAVRETPEDVRRRARTMDQGAVIVLLLTMVGVVACLLTIITAAEEVKQFAGGKGAAAAVVAVTVVLTWMVTQTSFALHYAHLYYGDCESGDDDEPGPSKGRHADHAPRVRGDQKASASPQKAHRGKLKREQDVEYETVGGLEFPGDEPPDYLDFAYFSFVLGMTFQVSDVQITHRGLRRLSLVHALISFFFTTVIVALTINMLASLAQP